MISNQILQNTIDGLKGITRVDMCIIDTEGKVLATTFPDADNYINPALAFVESPADSQVIQGCQFFKVFDDHQIESGNRQFFPPYTHHHCHHLPVKHILSDDHQKL